MRDAVILSVHLIVTFTRLAKPGGIRSMVAESLLVKHQLVILKSFTETSTQSKCVGSDHRRLVRDSNASRTCCPF